MTDVVANQISIIFILIGFGFFLKKIGMITEGFTKTGSDLMVHVTLPLLVVVSMDREFSPSDAENGLLLFAIGAIMYIIHILLGKLLSMQVERENRDLYSYMIIFGNVGFLGYPLMRIAFGEIGVFYAAFFNLWFQILNWTLGIKLMSGAQMNLKRVFTTPGVLAIFAGLFLFFTPFTLPSVIRSALSMIGDVSTPLSMFLIGSFLAEAKLSDFVANPKLYLAAAVKLVVAPALMFLVLSFFKLEQVVETMPVLMSAMPTGINAAIFAKKFGRNYKLASQGVVVSTAFSLITLSALMSLLL